MNEEAIFYPFTKFVIGGDKQNKKQIEFIINVFDKDLKANYYAYGGAIRGGKSFVVLFILHRLCMLFPQSKWVVVRATLPVLKTTTIPSFKKVIDTNKFGKWNNSAPITFSYDNGSKIIFMPESITIDPDLNNFLGLECNGFFLEQTEELNEHTFDMCKQRAGSHYINPMPKPFIFATFNPTQNWTKKKWYEPFKNNCLDEMFYFLEALPTDNPHVTEAQYKAWQSLPERDRRKMIEADWTNFDDNDARWIYVDWRKRLVDNKIEFIKEYPIIVSIDFNNNPMSCTVWQFTDGVHDITGGKNHFINCIDEFIASTKDAGEEVIGLLGKKVKASYPNSFIWVTGDANGRNSLKGAPQNKAGFNIFCDAVGMPYSNIKVRGANMQHTVSRSLFNMIMHNYLNLKISKLNTPLLIKEFEIARTDPKGKPDDLLKDRGDYCMDLFDTAQYIFQNYFSYFVK